MARRPSAPKSDQAERLRGAWQAFAAFLHRRGDRVTRARRTVFEAVMARHDHFRADELARDLRQGPRRVSRGTVYRTLSLMEQAGLVRTVRDEDLHRHYEHTIGRHTHDHMICTRCGAFVEFTDPALPARLDRQCRRQGFVRTHHRLAVYGLCRACAGRASRGRR